MIPTSSGCVCDDSSECAPQGGQPFGWCMVKPGCEGSLLRKDPLGNDHRLYRRSAASVAGEPAGREGSRTTRSWDYCVAPAENDGSPPEEPRSAHNCSCSPRWDVLERHRYDPVYRVPLADQLTVRSMRAFRDGQD